MDFLGRVLHPGKPIVIYTCNRWVNVNSPNPFDILVQNLSTEKIIFIVGIWWTVEAEVGSSERLLAWVNKIQKKYKNTKIILSANTEKEYNYLNSLNASCIFCNQNIFKDYSIFKINNVPNKYDAVYNAQFLRFKRHHLAKYIDRLALIGYNFSADTEYFNEIKTVLPNADIVNEIEKGHFKFFSKKQCNEIINMAHVGICLSEKEGPMYASMEYLLADLPVVSTPSYGGRDLFFDEINSAIVDPNPTEIAKAVKKFIIKRPPFGVIRNRVIEIIDRKRIEFIKFVDDLIWREGGSKKEYLTDNWNNIFIDQLLETASVEKFISNCKLQK